MFRSRVADSRLLVVLDNAADAAQVTPLLPAASGCGVLVTSRRALAALDGARHVDLGVLPAGEAIELLVRLVGQERVTVEADEAAEVARLCGWLPLALRIAGCRLAARPGWPVRTLAQRLANAQCRLDELELAEVGVRAGLAGSYEQLRASDDPVDRAAAGAFGLLGCWIARRWGGRSSHACWMCPSTSPSEHWSGWSTPTCWGVPPPVVTECMTCRGCMPASSFPPPWRPPRLPARSGSTWRPPGTRSRCCVLATSASPVPTTAGARTGWSSPTPGRRSGGCRPSGPTCWLPRSRPRSPRVSFEQLQSSDADQVRALLADLPSRRADTSATAPWIHSCPARFPGPYVSR